MLVVDLHCKQGHQFEGWFASAEDLASQQARGLVSCPVCGELDVVRRPSAPHLNTSGLKGPAPVSGSQARPPSGPGSTVARPVSTSAQGEPAPDQPDAQAVQALRAMYVQAIRHIVQHTEDVGERFADEVRSMHHGDAPERAIRGQASAEERQALRDEGIDVLSLPVPDGIDGSVH